MNLLKTIEELPDYAITLQIFHRNLKIPLNVYLDTVQNFNDPWQEEAYQFFAQKYLEEVSDPGILGMVRQAHDRDFVFLDVAIRYPAKHEL